ncbi:hypothetical protein EMIT0357P_120020 [Pseudomonas marginalis]
MQFAVHRVYHHVQGEIRRQRRVNFIVFQGHAQHQQRTAVVDQLGRRADQRAGFFAGEIVQAIIDHDHVGAFTFVAGQVQQVTLLERQAPRQLVLLDGAFGGLARGGQVPDFALDLRVPPSNFGDIGAVSTGQVDDLAGGIEHRQFLEHIDHGLTEAHHRIVEGITCGNVVLEAVLLLEIHGLGAAQDLPEAWPVLPLQALVGNDRADELSAAADQETLGQGLVGIGVGGLFQQAQGDQAIEKDLRLVGHPAQLLADRVGGSRAGGVIEEVLRYGEVKDGGLSILVGEFHQVDHAGQSGYFIGVLIDGRRLLRIHTDSLP